MLLFRRSAQHSAGNTPDSRAGNGVDSGKNPVGGHSFADQKDSITRRNGIKQRQRCESFCANIENQNADGKI